MRKHLADEHVQGLTKSCFSGKIQMFLYVSISLLVNVRNFKHVIFGTVYAFRASFFDPVYFFRI